MSPHIAKLFKNPLALAGAALVIHIGAAAAADSTGDVQQKMRELLGGTPATHSTTQPRLREGNATSPTVDSQEFLRQLLGAATPSHVRDPETIKHSEVAGAPGKTEARRVAYGDPQAAARAVVLGLHEASDAAYLAARPPH